LAVHRNPGDTFALGGGPIQGLGIAAEPDDPSGHMPIIVVANAVSVAI
jgi:hypothetical protein